MGLFPARDPGTFYFPDIRYEKSGWVAPVTINRPHAYNTYSTPALHERAAVRTPSSAPIVA